MKYLIVAAHPDDEVLGAGGAIYKWTREGHIVDVQCFILQKSCNSAIIMTGNERMCLQKSQQTAITLRTAKFRAFSETIFVNE